VSRSLRIEKQKGHTMSSLSLSPQLLTQAELSRVSLLSSVLAQLLTAVDVPFSLAVCGSVAVGQAHEASDIELFFVVNHHDIHAFVDNAVFQHIFNVSYPTLVLDDVMRGDIQSLRIPDVLYQGMILSANIYTNQLCDRIANLDSGVVVKYRQSAKTEFNQFRGFDWQHTGMTITRESHCHAYAGGYISSDEIVHIAHHQPFFHIYVDKLMGAFCLWDELNIRQHQVNLYHHVVTQCAQLQHSNPLGFMYKINSAQPYQLQAITNQRTQHACYDQQIVPVQSRLTQISGPTGVGKDTVISLILHADEQCIKVPCVTTRAPRVHAGDDYHFVSVAQFFAMIRQEQFFFWHFDGYDNVGTIKLYGIRYADIMPLIDRHSSLIFSIGGSTAARFLRRRYPDATTIWLQPDSIAQLAQQIGQRQGALDAEMRQRLTKLTPSQLHASSYFGYSIINKPNYLSDTFAQVCEALNYEHTGVFV
jgi:guanylate kinase